MEGLSDDFKRRYEIIKKKNLFIEVDEIDQNENGHKNLVYLGYLPEKTYTAYILNGEGEVLEGVPLIGDTETEAFETGIWFIEEYMLEVRTNDCKSDDAN